ncbi:uncharacterized protein EV420DRAFT_1676285 [Desarmillaria tabescens]|uniref:Heterokaryon incompatibility domain-containing protein n=1 Tax=Armillaria tabescens TaxID=1929756 RepID=A0AA39MIM1_ARMTA|nr:uncharacterized protein EV420DRAFT_1676285 [Desarmillaria tabescens]KAK0435707.1 hypothetical protein EV420DRAFT_1676285 [Desarmillaria tabescens]
MVIPSDLANTPCADLKITGVLENFNVTLSTSYTLDCSPILKSFLESCIENNYDFGTAYAHFHPNKCHDPTTIEDGLCKRKVKDKEDREMISTRQVHPWRMWDLFANRVVPYWVFNYAPWGISHTWMDEKDRKDVWTPINGYEWPVPMPKDADLNLIHIEMLNKGVVYVWLDVLCLRQKYHPRQDHLEEDHCREKLCMEEWKLDMPTIGYVYDEACVMYYLSGLGQPLSLTPGYFDTWTLQESGGRIVIGGDTGNDKVQTTFYEKLKLLRDIHSSSSVGNLLLQMQKWVSTYPIDRVAGLVYCLRSSYIPIYDAEQSEESAWVELVNAMDDLSLRQLLFCYPEPGSRSKFW